MGTKLQARILHSLATCDQFDGVGRLFIGEARIQLSKPELTVEDILAYWKEYYPDETAEAKQTNMILIYFDGKETLQQTRIALAEPLIMNAEKEPEYNKNPEVYQAETETYPDPETIPANKPDENNVIW